MRLRIVAVGKVKQRGMRELLDDYVGRIGRYARCDEQELPDLPEVEMAARFRRAVPRLQDGGRGKVVALEVGGQPWDSHRLARFVDRCAQDAEPELSFLIGGAYGLPPEISRAADLQLSLSAMTLPHRLARLLLAEQLYRAFTILRNEPYSH